MRRTMVSGGLGVWILLAAGLPRAEAMDLIGSAVRPPRWGAREALERRYAALGVEGDRRAASLGALGSADAAYFARAPQRVQVVSGLTFEHWGGALALAVGLPAIAYLSARIIANYGD